MTLNSWSTCFSSWALGLQWCATTPSFQLSVSLWSSRYPSSICWKHDSFSRWIIFIVLTRVTWQCVRIYFWTFSFILSMQMVIAMPGPRCLDYCSFVVVMSLFHMETRKHIYPLPRRKSWQVVLKVKSLDLQQQHLDQWFSTCGSPPQQGPHIRYPVYYSW